MSFGLLIECFKCQPDLVFSCILASFIFSTSKVQCPVVFLHSGFIGCDRETTEERRIVVHTGSLTGACEMLCSLFDCPLRAVLRFALR